MHHHMDKYLMLNLLNIHFIYMENLNQNTIDFFIHKISTGSIFLEFTYQVSNMQYNVQNSKYKNSNIGPQ